MLNYSTFLPKHLEVIDLSLTFAPVFFIVLDLRLTKVWVTAVTLFICLFYFFFFRPNRNPYPFISFLMRRNVSTATKPLLTIEAM